MSYTVEKLDDFGRGIINVDNKICFVKNVPGSFDYFKKLAIPYKN